MKLKDRFITLEERIIELQDDVRLLKATMENDKIGRKYADLETNIKSELGIDMDRFAKRGGIVGMRSPILKLILGELGVVPVYEGEKIVLMKKTKS